MRGVTEYPKFVTMKPWSKRWGEESGNCVGALAIWPAQSQVLRLSIQIVVVDALPLGDFYSKSKLYSAVESTWKKVDLLYRTAPMTKAMSPTRISTKPVDGPSFTSSTTPPPILASTPSAPVLLQNENNRSGQKLFSNQVLFWFSLLQLCSIRHDVFLGSSAKIP